jgi:hypothetical protein
VTNPRANSVHLKLESVIRSDSSYHPTIDGFRAALSLEGQQPFIHVDIPKTKSEAETHIAVDQDVEFASADAFAGFTKAVVAAETFKLHLTGKTKVHLKGLPAMNVNFNKVITMKGTSINLPVVSITTLTLPRPKPPLRPHHNLSQNPPRRLQHARHRKHPQPLPHDHRPR